eukprot:Nitzschia sp. Nitz4//scaffold16_size188269//121144//123025//NITZ4_001801-RA/size188269-augustus-gene-0.95-mRNA-1//-1//CDS//3329538547//1805//frame0
MVSFHALAAPLLLVLSSLLFTTVPVVADDEEDDHLLESAPNLPLGDVNVVVLTDVHSWIAGHSHKEPYLNVDYGEVLSFYQRLKAYCDSVDTDLWIVMNGDWVDGTGLSLDGDTSSIVPLLQKMPFHIVNTGNHELYKSRVIDSMTRAGGFIDWWGGRHLSSNIVMTSDPSSHLSNRYYLLEGINSNVLVFGFIYHMYGAASEVTVLDPADVVQESWFQKALKEESYDAILVMAHMGTDDPAVSSIISAIRSHVGDNMPVQFVTGHTHMRRFSQVDEYSTAVESGRYLDTVGFVSFPTRHTVPDDNSTMAHLFQHVFLDANVNNLKYALGGEHEFATDDGQELSDFIQRTREHMGLTEIIGCAPGNYYMNYSMSHKESLWGLFRDEVVPVALQGVSGIQSVLIISTDNFRYDLFYGENSYDDIVAVAPFDDTLHFVGQMPCSTVLAVHEAIPDYVLAGTALANETCQLYVPDFDLSTVVAKLEELFPESSYVPIATGHSTTTLWVDFVESEWPCSSSIFDVPKVLDDSGKVVWKNLTLVILIVLAILFGMITCLVLGWKLIKCVCYGRTPVSKEEMDSIVADRDMAPQFT